MNQLTRSHAIAQPVNALRRDAWHSFTTLATIALAGITFAGTAASAATCPFDTGGSDALNDGVVLTRYALGITGAPLIASTRYASLDPLQVKSNIECVGCALDINGDGVVDTVDTTIIARHLTGFQGASLTAGLALGAGTRNTPAAVTSFLVNGCAVGGAINAFVQGGNAFSAPAMLGTTDAQPLVIKANAVQVMRYDATQRSPNISGGYVTNSASGPGAGGATVAGGGQAGLICYDTVTGTYTRDCHNLAGADFSTVSGGKGNKSAGNYGTVSGGYSNEVSLTADFGAVGGGFANVASGFGSTIAGGRFNTATGSFSAVPGGFYNLAQDYASFAAGNRAKALHANSFVWGGSDAVDTATNGAGQFVVYAPGGVLLFAGAIGAGGCSMYNGTSGWSCASDRGLKTNIRAIDPVSILQRLVAMPVTSWSMKSRPDLMQIGPMAQDFFAAFGLGDTDKMINTTNAQGVALAAIQGLNQLLNEKLSEKDVEIKKQALRIEQQGSRMQALEKALSALQTRLGIKSVH